ncbi:parB-like partition protein [Rhodomicrobium vannielii ATCC 17100]|uniref:ParB-like partition protein n=1 Tax=Rhodomicrobium vannielii (strain ATCC 17100 / DSM 162 / LMG 4299 / NCIMB 10020 / ATH 3.1.1) TaxID=648757 RepID=E3I7F2_RHOVT|nr:ParB/RepB/Spo0J family partition protein [Rhodomicrobium vannielii]ADP71871.1 parB-like partition protein [Rhodomicrobium vannielii ATCC 17100]
METRSGALATGPSPVRASRLGRGLASLIGDATPIGTPRIIAANGEIRQVPIDRVRPSAFNPRKNFNEAELDELAGSIREKGLVQPIVVRPADAAQTSYEIVAGERRWRAAQRASLHTVPVIVRSLSDQEALELAIIENVQRADLNAIEEAGGYKELVERFGYTQEELAGIIGKSRSHLANTMRLLKLPEPVQVLVRDGSLSAGHARALIGREDAETVALDIVKKGLNVRDVEALVMGKKASEGKAPTAKAAAPQKDADSRAAERDMSDALGLSVVMNPGSGEAGEVIIRYKTLEQFQVIYRALLTQKG